MTYEINLEDIRAYVASIPEDQPVGMPQHRYQCLIARTLQRKYPGKDARMYWGNERALIGHTEKIDVPEDVYQIGEKFDALWDEDVNVDDPFTYGDPVTPAVLRERMPELFETQEV